MNIPDSLGAFCFGEILCYFRTRAGYSQKQMAMQIARSRNTVSLWERSYYLPESREIIYEIAKVLKLSEEEERWLAQACYGPVSTTLQNSLLLRQKPPKEKKKKRRSLHTSQSAIPFYYEKRKSVAAEKKRGRPRKGGVDADLRRGFEVTFDVKTIALLDTVTNNRSEYLETLVLERFIPTSGEEEQFQAELLVRCKELPANISQKLEEIWASLGIRAAWEASEVLFLFEKQMKE